MVVLKRTVEVVRRCLDISVSLYHLEEFNSLIGYTDQQRRLRDCLTHLSLLHESPECIRLKRAITDLLSGMSSAEQFQNNGREMEMNDAIMI